MNLIRTSVYSSISATLRIISAFIVNKLVAVYIGPAGLTVIGNLQNAINILLGLSTCAINSGVVKYTAEFTGEPDQLKSLFSTSFRIILISSSLVGLISILFAPYIAIQILHQVQYAYLFVLFGVTVFLYAFNVLILAILNGRKEISRFTLANIMSGILSLLITSGLIYCKHLTGALISVVVTQSTFFFLSFYFISRCNWFSVSIFFGKASKEVANKLFRYTAMGITSAIAGPLSLLFIRNHIVKNVSMEGAGYWEGISRISSVYLMMVTSSLAIYYLPKLSETQGNREVRNEIGNGYKIIMPIVVGMSIVIYILRYFIIRILFTAQFGPMEELFLFQLIGDIIKVASWLLAFLMLAKAMAKIYIITEIIFSFTYFLLSVFFINHFGLKGVTYAYTINYSLYFFTCYFILHKKFTLKE